ncbi:MAG: hypothetical protein ACJAY2_002635 [Pseudomonadales bacterium]|jgi:hypothetical protein
MRWTFLNDHRIPLKNNTATCALRSSVIWRTLSVASLDYPLPEKIGCHYKRLRTAVNGHLLHVVIKSTEY